MKINTKNTEVLYLSTNPRQWRSHPKNLGGRKILGGPECLISGEEHYFVRKNASQSTKLLYFPKIWGRGSFGPPPGYVYDPRHCMLQVSGNTLQQVEKFRHLGVLFASDERWREVINTRIVKANAVLRELHRAVVTKRELSNTTKLSVFRSVFVPILTNGHESRVMTERILTQVQATEMGFLRRVHGVTRAYRG